ncbi:MAG TPA: hypothetical protein VLA56_08535 [Pseudomonadales bacterium]|nr:hypothetical protein [Pseudomonadales bacterium]
MELVAANLESDDCWTEAAAGVDAVHHLAPPLPVAAPKDPMELIRPRWRARCVCCVVRILVADPIATGRRCPRTASRVMAAAV